MSIRNYFIHHNCFSRAHLFNIAWFYLCESDLIEKKLVHKGLVSYLIYADCNNLLLFFKIIMVFVI